jgi:predicted transcriptional regulator YheO
MANRRKVYYRGEGTHKTIPGKSPDDILLDSYKVTIEALTEYLGKAYEMVLYDLRKPKHSIIKIINGKHSKRKEHLSLPADMLFLVESMKKSSRNLYRFHSTEYKLLKRIHSVAILISGEGGKPIGLLCINLYLNSSLFEFLDALNIAEEEPKETEFVSSISARDKTIEALREAQDKVYFNASIPNSLKNKEIIRILNNLGIFKIKKAIDIVSKDLGLAKSTLYLHLRNIEKE